MEIEYIGMLGKMNSTKGLLRSQRSMIGGRDVDRTFIFPYTRNKSSS